MPGSATAAGDWARPSVRYSIRPVDPAAHHLQVDVTISAPARGGQRLSLPAWIPGSYLVRDYARHVLEIGASSDGRPVALSKTGKAEWQAAQCDGELTVRLLVYAWDLSVRGAHVDTTHAYFNGVCVFPRVEGRDDEPLHVDIEAPPDGSGNGWRVATSMNRDGAPAGGFGRYIAADYDELIDHPVEIGDFSRATFEACGVPHEIAITGRHRADLPRLCRDLGTLCEHHIRFFGEPAPIDRYLFLVTALGEGYGGLEHRWSSSLHCRRGELPQAGVDRVTDEYRRFLGLCSHEYFHLWNVKRMRPAAFARSDLSAEALSSLLWVFEGITSYYDDLALVRSGLIEPASYLELVGKNLTRVMQTPGRLRQSLHDSSVDAWIKLYKRDENADNAIISYYGKGALVALALDLTIRRDTAGRLSLDDVMRAMWARYGQDGPGLPEDGFERLAAEVTGLNLAAFFDTAIRGTDDPHLAALFETVGVTMTRHVDAERDGDKPVPDAEASTWLGVTPRAENGRTMLAAVREGAAASRAGLSAGDELLAIDGLRASHDAVKTLLAGHAPGDRVEVAVFRRDELMRFDVTLDEAPCEACRLTLAEDADPEAVARREGWLAGAPPA